MKDTIANILNQCSNNKPLNDFNLVLTLLNYLKDDKTTYKTINKDNDSIGVIFLIDNWELSIRFYDDNTIGITLPYSGLFIIKNCEYNMQYNDIRNILQAL